MLDISCMTLEDIAKEHDVALTGDKYEYTGETKSEVLSEDDEPGICLNFRQIRATKTFTAVDGRVITAGTLGGWLSTDSILDQNGNCWVDETSKCVRSVITGNALVADRSKVFGSKLLGNTKLSNCTADRSCYLKNVVATSSRLSHINTYVHDVEAATLISITDSRVTDFRLARDARTVTIANLGTNYSCSWANVSLIDNAAITSRAVFAEILLEGRWYAIYPVVEAAETKVVVCKGASVVSRIPAILKPVYESICNAVASEAESQKTGIFG